VVRADLPIKTGKDMVEALRKNQVHGSAVRGADKRDDFSRARQVTAPRVSTGAVIPAEGGIQLTFPRVSTGAVIPAQAGFQNEPRLHAGCHQPDGHAA
jgi:hypothetical protein